MMHHGTISCRQSRSPARAYQNEPDWVIGETGASVEIVEIVETWETLTILVSGDLNAERT